MEIVKIPIVEFFKYSLDGAYKQGFSWIMCLLARDADAEEIYVQIKKYWNSLHDLTGKNILFVFAGKQIIEKQPNSLLLHETIGYRALTNPSIRFVDDNTPKVPHHMYPAFDYDSYQINEIEVTHTRSITELKDFFGLSEKDVPSLIFVPTHRLVREEIVIVQLPKENLYLMVKTIIESLEESLSKLKKAQDDYAHIENHLDKVNYKIWNLKGGTNAQMRFTETKEYLDNFIRALQDDEQKKYIQDALRSNSVYDRKKIDRQTRIYLHQYHDLLKQYPTLKDDQESIALLEAERIDITSARRKIHNNVTSLYNELAKMIQNINKQLSSSIMTDVHNSRRFKIALSFPGEHRDLVEKIAEKLAAIYGNDQILYDRFHRAEFARRNLDTHLQKLYHDESDLIVVFICTEYQEKKWCGIEWRSIRDLLNTKEADNRIMFIKCGQGSVDGIFSTIDGYIDSLEVPIDDIKNDIIKRHSSII